MNFFEDWNDAKVSFMVEQTFSIADWILLDEISKKEFDYLSLPTDVFLRLFFNIVPGGDSFLHRLCKLPSERTYNIIAHAF